MIILILFSYCIASFGVSLDYFYCCGKLKSISIQKNENRTECKGDFKKGCCRHEKKLVKLKIDQKTSVTNNEHSHQLSDVTIPYFNDYSFVKVVFYEDVKKVFYQIPPPKFSFSRNIFYCVYRI